MGIQELMQLLKEQDPVFLPVLTPLAWMLYLCWFACLFLGKNKREQMSKDVWHESLPFFQENSSLESPSSDFTVCLIG